ncbi:2672_t:CDS:2, partial [Ambispora leptoticha]
KILKLRYSTYMIRIFLLKTREFIIRPSFRSLRYFSSTTILSTINNNDKKKENDQSTSKTLKERIKIVLNESDLEESFIRGSGPGGQKINKSSICVYLKHVPTNIRVRCQQSRSREENRGIARHLLKLKLDEFYNGEQSKLAAKREKIRKREAKRRSRSKAKYGKKSEETNDEIHNDDDNSELDDTNNSNINKHDVN